MSKTAQVARRKRKLCRKLFIHISNKSVSNKLKNVSMESSKLLCLNGISFCSKSCKLKTFSFSIASVLTLIMDRPRPWGLEVIHFDLCWKWHFTKRFNTYRTTDSVAKLWERNNGIDKGTPEIQQVIYVQRFTGRVSAHFLHIEKLLVWSSQRNTAAVKFRFLSHLLSYTHNFLLREGLIYKKCVKAVSFH